MTKHLFRFLIDEGGTTAIEYGLIAGGIALVIITAVMLVGDGVRADFESVNSDWPH